eukprot:gnl/TRDRNA2_/TRDRNA2_181418_c0_seq1.p1 gnl/TRDRNA2_/TRDRNA2_181418_c0~~gnl/TRDRNA2_/TRDRNA2_181418_c0_seq1.p1  ORF type:complete len:339 (+),score=65.68 gnl/TRDRNA2_/TRDRNA2_181418_c0_seq1:138-1154(+)
MSSQGEVINLANDPFLTHTKAAGRSSAPKEKETAPAPQQTPTQTAPGAPYKARAKVGKEYPLKVAQWVGVFVVIALMFTFFYHLCEWVCWVLTAIGIYAAALAGVGGRLPQDLPKSIAAVRRMPSQGGWLPFSIALLGVCLGTLTGLYAYEYYMRFYYAIHLGRAYDNVLASSSGAAYYDAGKIYFAESTTIDTANALGYKEMQTFCVAPILDDSNQLQATADFWAVGIDCCGERGEFECGGSGDAGAKGGMRVPMNGLLDFSHKSYMKAVEQASAISGLKPQDPVLVYWVSNPDQEEHLLLSYTWGILALSTAAYVLVVVIVSTIGWACGVGTDEPA